MIAVRLALVPMVRLVPALAGAATDKVHGKATVSTRHRDNGSSDCTATASSFGPRRASRAKAIASDHSSADATGSDKGIATSTAADGSLASTAATENSKSTAKAVG